jgi:hypothetical protein
LTTCGSWANVANRGTQIVAYTIKYLGYDVACDSPEELRALLGQNGIQPNKTPLGKEVGSGVASFIAKLQGKPRELLRLIAAGGTVPRDRLAQAVGVSDPHKFGGLLITISKCATGSGIDSPIERITERNNGNEPRTYQYKIRDVIKAEVKEALTR